ncbi:hypothetical protein BGX26_006836 [Mortierella sp. AD094]|nr:hypothetical protein BGX26_006836 [Mortierella sp. AD094]
MSLCKDLPNELFFQIGVYLNRHQLVSSALVCKSWSVAFMPLIWSHLEIGSDKAISALAEEDISSKASWIRTLAFEDCESTIRYANLGKRCTQLRSLAITTSSVKDAQEMSYWRACRDLVKRNRRTLVSLMLTDMHLPASKPKYGGSNWSPLLSIAQCQHSSLRILRLESCELPYRHLNAFWDICEKLEVLELHNVPFELPRLCASPKTTTRPGNHQQKPNLGSNHQQRVVRFSNLLELTLDESGPRNSLTQLEQIIRQAPKLKKLDWNTRYAWFPAIRFMYLFSGDAKYHRTPAPQSVKHCVPLELCTTPCWPNLESLRMKRWISVEFDPEDYLSVVKIFKRLQFLDIPLRIMTPTIVDSLLQFHSNTLTVIDWRRIYSEQYVALIHQILSSCPKLAKVLLRSIHAQDLIEGGDSWVCCDQLEELRFGIEMSPLEWNPPRPDMTDQEKQDMSWAVFKQLGRLRKLRILDVKTPLQYTTSMGLPLLSNLKELETIEFYGNQNMTPEDVDWMVENLTSLNKVKGNGRLAVNRSRYGDRKNPWDCTVATMFNKHGIKTPGSVYREGYLDGLDEVIWDYPQTESVSSDIQIEVNPLDAMSPSTDLPNEIYFQVGVYLNRHQLINCTLVCQSWNAAFESQLWSYLEIGSDKAISHLKAEDIYNKASWIRSLAFKDYKSALQHHSIGKRCTRLRSLAIPVTRGREALRSGYWKACKDLVKQNKATLVSLSLIFIPPTASDHIYGSSNWNPLLSISQYPHSGLRSLRLENCELPYRHLATFWDVCERLEVLELHKVPFEPPYSYNVHGKAFGPEKRPEWNVPFSNLLELTLDRSGPKNSLTQLEEIIRQASKLKKLSWNTEEGAWVPIARFMYLFSGRTEYRHTPAPQSVRHCVPLAACSAPCWPNLESLAMRNDNYHPLYFQFEDYLAIVNMSKRLRVLDLPLSVMTSDIMEPLLRLHSSTLTEIDLRRTRVYKITGLEFFSSCPRLTKACLQYLSAKDFIGSDNHWECCDQLEELRVFISMDSTSSQPDLMDQRNQDMSRAVFKQLGRLHKLKILDLTYEQSEPGWPLQFTKSMGLTSLSNLTELEMLVLQGDQNMTPGDVNWILEHWKSLKEIDGGMMLAPQRYWRFLAKMNPRDCTLATMLNKHGIKTPRSVYPDGYLSNFEKVDWDTKTEFVDEANPLTWMDSNIFDQVTECQDIGFESLRHFIVTPSIYRQYGTTDVIQLDRVGGATIPGRTGFGSARCSLDDLKLEIAKDCRCNKAGPQFAEKNFWDCALATMFNDHGIKTPRSIFTSYTAGKRFNYEELDWSFYPQANCQTEANPLDKMDIDIF